MKRFLTVLFFLTITGSSKASDLYFLKDTIRKVEIKIIVTEKQQQVNFDSIYQSMNSFSNKTQSINKKKNEHMKNALPVPEKVNTITPDPNTLPIHSKPSSRDNKASITIKVGLKPLIDSQVKKEAPKYNHTGSRIDLAWIGFVLTLGGIVLGLIFGRTAFLVTLFGTVLLVVGSFLKI
jgi:hypothetical protein